MDYKRLKSFLDILECIPNDEKRDKALQLLLLNSNDVSTIVPHEKESKQKCNIEMESMDETIQLKFTQKEIVKMPERFQKIFILQNKIVSCRKRKSGRHGINYEIRYRRDGFNISVSSNNLEIAKSKFIQALIEIEVNRRVEQIRAQEEEKERKALERLKEIGAPDTFHEFAMYYFDKYRSRKVSPKTFENDGYRYKNYIQPHFGSMPITDITPPYCQELLDKIVSSGKTKTGKEVFSILNAIFKMAIAHDIISKNPLAIAYVEKHTSKHGKALTKQEEKELLDSLKGSKYQAIVAMSLYTGLRPNELNTVKIEGDFVVARNSKRKGGKVEYKKIPITKMLKPYVQEFMVDKLPGIQYIRDKFNAVLPNHIYYDLRTTFYTRCEECGVAEAARDYFVGHSRSRLNDTYSDLSDEYLLQEGSKLVYSY